MIARRLVTIPVLLGVSALVLALLPAIGAATLVVDLVLAITARRRWMATRIFAFLCVYLVAELMGLAALLAVWAFAGVGAHRPTRIVDGTYAVQRWWTAVLFRATRAIFSLTFEIEGDEAVGDGPLLVFVRHASIVDTLLPSVFITAKHRMRLRFVLKRELLQDPCLDVAGLRLPNAFVARGAVDGAVEIARVRALAEDLGPREGVLIYPEGTRFSRAKRQRALAKLEASNRAAYDEMRALEHVLPPKLGGPLALLDACDADVLFFGHTGLEGFAEVGDIWRGAMVGKRVRMRVWRVPRASIPADDGGRAAWLANEWRQLDAWIQRVDEADRAATSPTANGRAAARSA